MSDDHVFQILEYIFISKRTKVMYLCRLETGTGDSETGSGEQPKTYRPLVKHFNPDSENYGFDLAKVKMERGASPPRRQLLLATPSKESEPAGAASSADPPPSFQARRQNQLVEPEKQKVDQPDNATSTKQVEDKKESGVEKMVTAVLEEEQEAECVDLIDDEDGGGDQEAATISMAPVGEGNRSRSSSISSSGAPEHPKKEQNSDQVCFIQPKHTFANYVVD